MWSRLTPFFTLALWGCSSLALAVDPEQFVESDTFELSVATGLGNISNPVTNKDDIPLFVLPNISYYGENFYLHNTNLGYKLFESKSLFIDLYSRADSFGFFHLNNATLSVSTFNPFNSGRHTPKPQPFDVKRSIAYLAGFKTGLMHDNHSLTIETLFDVTKVHHGFSASINYQTLFQTRIGLFNIDVGVDYLSSKQNGYYFYFKPDELTKIQSGMPDTLALNSTSMASPKPTWVPSLKLEYQYPLSDSISVISFFEYQQLNNNAFERRLIKRSHIQTFFLGINWKLYEG